MTSTADSSSSPPRGRGREFATSTRTGCALSNPHSRFLTCTSTRGPSARLVFTGSLNAMPFQSQAERARSANWLRFLKIKNNVAAHKNRTDAPPRQILPERHRAIKPENLFLTEAAYREIYLLFIGQS